MALPDLTLGCVRSPLSDSPVSACGTTRRPGSGHLASPERGCLGFDKSDLALGEQLSSTPWHALPEHRPLGSINRARRVVYDAVSKYRHEQNNEPRREPTAVPR
jgi:hypothetical protein